MEEYKEEVLADYKMVDVGGGTPLIKTITVSYIEQRLECRIPAYHGGVVELARAKDTAIYELAKLLANGLKYHREDVKAYSRVDYVFSVGIMMDKEKDDLQSNISKLEQQVIRCKYREDELDKAIDGYLNEPLWSIITRWWRRSKWSR